MPEKHQESQPTLRMKAKEYLGEWYRFMDGRYMERALQHVVKGTFYPEARDVFKAFTFSKPLKTVCVMLGQDPYPQKGRATGLAFANPSNVKPREWSPSLQVLEEAAVDYEMPHGNVDFDCTLERWARQGVLLLNTSLTVEPGKPGSHSLYWRPFMEDFLKRYATLVSGVIYVLFGKQAQSFKHCLFSGYEHTIIEIDHPAAFARRGERMPPDLFYLINDNLRENHLGAIEWYNETYSY